MTTQEFITVWFAAITFIAMKGMVKCILGIIADTQCAFIALAILTFTALIFATMTLVSFSKIEPVKGAK